MGIHVLNAPYLKRVFRGIIIMILENWNTRVLLASDLACSIEFTSFCMLAYNYWRFGVAFLWVIFPIWGCPHFFLIFCFHVSWKVSALWVKKTQKSAKKSQQNAQYLWVDYVYSSTISIFAKECNLDEEFLEVGSSLDWGVLTFNENERICSEHVNSDITFMNALSLFLVFARPWLLFR